jgi:hypothetical protein
MHHPEGGGSAARPPAPRPRSPEPPASSRVNGHQITAISALKSIVRSAAKLEWPSGSLPNAAAA